MTIASEYQRYQKSPIMKRLAVAAHGNDYIGQTSSATYEQIFSRLKTDLSPESVVLDAGCGNGAFGLLLTEDLSCHVHGIDLSDSLIEEATRKAHELKLSSKCQFQVADFTDMAAQPPVMYDQILSIGSLYWGQSLEKTFSTWRKLTKVRGHLLLFSNLLYHPLNEDETAAIGATQFIPALFLESALGQHGWALQEWSDETQTYIEWLRRWCKAMERWKDDLYSEMEEAAALQLFNRFNTYLRIAERGAVRRIILRGEHV